MTRPDLVTLLRSMPAVAMEAVREAKIAGPRSPLASGGTFRLTIDGRTLGSIWPYGNRWQTTCSKSGPIETHDSFAARIDAALVADGWVFSEVSDG